MFKHVSHPFFGSLALLVLRLVVGLAFLYHGWGKIQTPFNWMGETSNVPAILQFLAAVSEFGGGICLILGFLTPIAALGIASTMAVAVNMHMNVRKDPFVNLSGGSSYELALVYFGIALVFFALGPGRFSIDALIAGKRK